MTAGPLPPPQVFLTTGSVIRPGDRVLMTTPDPITHDHAQTLRGQLHERFPGVEFSIVYGLTVAAVQPTAAEVPGVLIRADDGRWEYTEAIALGDLNRLGVLGWRLRAVSGYNGSLIMERRLPDEQETPEA